MRIPIVDNIVMTSDANNIILNRETTRESGKKTGQKILSPYAYYPNIVQALEGVLNEKLAESTARSIKTLCRECHELVGHFRELLDGKIKANND